MCCIVSLHPYVVITSLYTGLVSCRSYFVSPCIHSAFLHTCLDLCLAVDILHPFIVILHLFTLVFCIAVVDILFPFVGVLQHFTPVLCLVIVILHPFKSVLYVV